MSEDERLEKRMREAATDPLDPLEPQLPVAPPPEDAPQPPKLSPELPPRPGVPRPGAVQPGSYQKMGMAYTAATSFIMPVVLLSLAGYFLDVALHHSTDWLAFVGVMVGLVVGVVALMNVMKRLGS